MNKASRSRQDASRRERIAAQRAAQRRAEMRNRVLLASGAVVVVVAVVVALVLIKTNSTTKSSPGVSNGPTGAALTSVISQTTSVPASVLDQVGAGSGVTPPSKISGPPLTSGGKPEVFYSGAEYCPYCAFERWAMVVSLSRFGTFSGLHTVHSSSTDVYANTPTWTFYKSSFTSRYLTFTPVEWTSNVPDSKAPLGYVPLQSPTAAQQALLSKYNPGGSFPFVDLGNQYAITGASSNPQVLSGKTWSQIAADLHSPSSPVAQAVDGTANYMTAALCKLTNDQPASACTPAVKALQAKL